MYIFNKICKIKELKMIIRLKIGPNHERGTQVKL